MNERRSSLQRRLAGAAACLERLDEARTLHGDLRLGKVVEEGIISRELLDLELQAFDQEIERLWEVTEDLLADVQGRNAGN